MYKSTQTSFHFYFQKGIVKFIRRQTVTPENKVNHWERNLVAVGKVGLIIGLFVASKV